MDSIAVVYWSGTGNTEAMANAMAEGAREAGALVEVFSIADIDATKLSEYGKIAFGCPSMGAEVLEEDEFEPFFASVEGSLAGKKVALFGSYGWGDGEWMRDWVARTNTAGASVLGEGLTVLEAPEGEECKDYGKEFAAF